MKLLLLRKDAAVLMLRKTAEILSVGASVPSNIVTNDDLTKIVETSDEWIVTRTGIKERRIATKDDPHAAADLGAKAARIALDRAGVAAKDVDMIICATFTPDSFFPSTGCKIQHQLGCSNASAFDISAACSGFVYGLSIARAMINSGQCETILLVGSEVISRTLDWSDRATCILFGDGAGAVVLKASDDENRGVLSTVLESDGSKGDILQMPAWGEPRFMSMRGNEVFKHAVRLMSKISEKACERAGISLEDIDYLIPHQANIRIINGLRDKLQLKPEKVVTNLEKYGNTSAASIPIALDAAWSDGKIKKDSVIVLTALGGGITIGSAAIRF